MFGNILIAFDGSEHACRAARLAGEFARQQADAKLWLVCVVEPTPKELGSPFIEELIVERTRMGEALFFQAKQLIGEGLVVQEELLFGTPAESIIEVAETRGCDLIIMGPRGVGTLRGLLLGSQVHKVISHAQCPVLVVK